MPFSLIDERTPKQQARVVISESLKMIEDEKKSVRKLQAVPSNPKSDPAKPGSPMIADHYRLGDNSYENGLYTFYNGWVFSAGGPSEDVLDLETVEDTSGFSSPDLK